MKQVYEIVPGVPTLEDADWNSAFAEVQKPFLRLDKTDDVAVELQIQSVQANWHIILHWLIAKKWHSRHKIPVSAPNDYEPLGEVYFRLLELTIQVHCLCVSPYVNAAVWFGAIIRAERLAQYKGIRRCIDAG